MNRRHPTVMALFILFVVALLSPLNNLFQPLEKTNPYADTEYQVAAVAVAAGLCVIVAVVRKSNLRLNLFRRDLVRLVFTAVRARHLPVPTVCVDTSPPRLTPLRI